MKVRFHGALGTVSGSCTELYDPVAGTHLLVDCGIKQGERNAEQWNQRPFPFNPEDLDLVVLTHAHVDHCGLIPLLYARGFRGHVHCTKPTQLFAKIMLENDCRHSALYTNEDVQRIQWRTLPLNEPQHIFGLELRLLRSAHILGAVSLDLRWGSGDDQGKFLFSGDLGNNRAGSEFQPLLRHAQTPEPTSHTKSYALMESTCAEYTQEPAHRSFENRQKVLLDHIVSTVLDKRGTLVLPAFALQRTQDLLFDLHYLFASDERLSEIPVYFDAGLASKFNSAYTHHLLSTDAAGEPLWLNNRVFEWMGMDSENLRDRDLLTKLVRAMLNERETIPGYAAHHTSPKVRNWRRIWTPTISRTSLPPAAGGPCIVITGGGMCDGGPVLNYLQKLLREDRHKVLLTGYCTPGSIGGKLIELSKVSRKLRAKLPGVLDLGSRRLPVAHVRAEICRLHGYQSHADRIGLLDWICPLENDAPHPRARRVFINHGSQSSRIALRKSLKARCRSIQVDLPREGNYYWFDLDANAWDYELEPLTAAAE